MKFNSQNNDNKSDFTSPDESDTVISPTSGIRIKQNLLKTKNDTKYKNSKFISFYLNFMLVLYFIEKFVTN